MTAASRQLTNRRAARFIIAAGFLAVLLGLTPTVAGAQEKPEITVGVEESTVVGNGTNEVVFRLTWTGMILADPGDYTYEVTNNGGMNLGGISTTDTFDFPDLDAGLLEIRFTTNDLTSASASIQETYSLIARPWSAYTVANGVTTGPANMARTVASATVTVTVPAPTAAPGKPEITLAAEANEVVGDGMNNVVFIMNWSGNIGDEIAYNLPIAPATCRNSGGQCHHPALADNNWDNDRAANGSDPDSGSSHTATSGTFRLELRTALLPSGSDPIDVTFHLHAYPSSPYTVANGVAQTASMATTASVTVTVTTSPSAPQNLAATPGVTSVMLSWEEPSSDGGAAITGYRIQQSADGNTPWMDVEANTMNTDITYTHSGLTADTAVYYRVSAINSAGEGAYSNTANATPTAASALPVVTVMANAMSVVGGTFSGAGPAVFTLTRTGDLAATLEVHLTWGNEHDGGYGNFDRRPMTATFGVDSETVGVSVPTASQQAGDTPAITLTVANDATGNDYTPGDPATASVTVTPRTNRPATGKPAITGTAAVGQRLTAGRGTIDDDDDLINTVFNYQWQRVDADGTSNRTNIGTNSDTYVLVAADQGHRILVTLIFVDELDNDEMRTSDPYPDSGTVAAATIPEVTVAPQTGGNSVVGGNDAVFTLTRSVASATALPVTFAITGSHSVTAPPTSMDIPADMTTVDVPVTTTAITGNDQTVILTVTDPSDGSYTVGSGTGGSATVTVTAAAPLPVVTVTPAAAQVIGGSSGPAVFVLTRTGDTAAALVVDYTLGGSNNAYGDINDRGPGMATIPAGSLTHQVSIPTSSQADGDAYNMMLTIDAVAGRYTVGTPASATVSVRENLSVGPPTGDLVISGTLEVGRTLTAVTTGLDDPDGLNTPSYTYSWRRADDASGGNEEQIRGELSSTYVLVDADLGKHIRAQVGFQDDNGNQEQAFSDWTANAVMAAQVDPAEPTIPEITVAASAASVVGGNDAVFTLTRTGATAAALPVTIAISGTHSVSGAPTTASIPANMRSVEVSVPTTEITGADETVILTVTAPSDGSYTVGSGTAGTATVTVTAPPIPEVTVAAKRARVVGGPSAPAVFTLTRTGATTDALPVNFEITGTHMVASPPASPASIPAGMTTVDVSVPTTEVTGPSETVILTIEDPGDNSYMVGAAGTATVNVTDPAQDVVDDATDHSLALLAPNLAANTVQVLTTRFESMAAGGPGGASRAANLAGRPLGAFADSGVSAAELAREVAGLFGLHLPAAGSAAARAANTPGLPGIFEAQSMEAQLGRGAGDTGDTGDWRAGSTNSLDSPELRRLLAQSSFSVGFGAAHGAHGGAQGGAHWTFWGRGAAGGFEGTEKDGALDIDGESIAAYLGADVQRGNLALGLAVGQSEGELDYANTAEGVSGDLETELTSVHPYLHWTLREDISLYAMLGYGTGEATRSGANLASLTSDLEMQMLAVGLRRALAASTAQRRYEVKLDAFWVDIESDGATRGDDTWAAVDSQSSRLRLALAGAMPLRQGLLAEAELAARLDGGDAQTGVGAELGAGLGWSSGGFSLSARGRVLLVHSEGEFEDYEEWGASLEASYRSGAMGRGLRLTLAPAWGDVQSGADALYESSGALRELGDGGGSGEGQRSSSSGMLPDRLDFELGYGLAVLGGRAELLPFGRFSTGEGAETRVRFGTRLDLPHRAGDALPVHRLGLEVFGETQAGHHQDRRVGLEMKLGF